MSRYLPFRTTDARRFRSGGCADDAHRRFPRLSQVRVSRPSSKVCGWVRLMIQFGFCSRAKHTNGLTTSTRTLKLSAYCTLVLSLRVQYTVLALALRRSAWFDQACTIGTAIMHILSIYKERSFDLTRNDDCPS